MRYLDRLKNKKAATSGTAITAKSPEDQILAPYYSFYSNPDRRISKNNLDDLLSEVGAVITTEADDSQALRFEPYLAGPQVDLERWTKAVELEDFFFKQQT